MREQNLISLLDMGKDDISELFEYASYGQELLIKYNSILKGYILGSLFFQPSTRTQFSFQSAFLRLGGNYIQCSNASQIRCGPPYYESMSDFGKIISNYCDIAVIRTSNEQDMYDFADSVSIPVISAGNGNTEHPTQAIIDLFTIYKLFGKIDSQNILIIGNPTRRAINSLMLGLNMWSNIHVSILCEEGVELNLNIKNQTKNLVIDIYHSWDELIEQQCLTDITIIYVGEIVHRSYMPGKYTLTIQKLEKYFSKYVQILSPLPRTEELSKCIDRYSGAQYFLQAKLGLYVRASLYLKYFI